MNQHHKTPLPRIASPVLLLLAFVATVQADLRTSSSYTVPTDTMDSGGQRATSAAYTNDGSVGGIVGISTVASPAEIAKAGYIGQLYEVAALQLAASPTSVDEGGTRQLSAAQLLDDSTTIALAADSITWSVQSGPLTGIDTNGLATAGIFYEDTAATAQGSFAGDIGLLPLTINNTNADDFGIYAADGIDDDWQVLYFGVGNSAAAPGIDVDGDKQDNFFEFIAGVIPTDPTSFFDQRLEPEPGQTQVIFSPRLTDRTYTVKTSTTLPNPNWPTLTGATVSDEGDERSVTDLHGTSVRKFYRVDITK